jgi:methionyl-tRNA synthetase
LQRRKEESVSRIYVTTSIPYVNARPHIGHALEFVQADTLARHWRRKGHQVRWLAGTDEHAPKNALAAEAAGVDTQHYVDRMSAAFEELRDLLGLSFDDFIRTSRDLRHRPGVERLWKACLDSGDLYRGRYEGLYCIGCEQYYKAGELDGDVCPEHGIRLDEISEENWFFRLSRYRDRLHKLIESAELNVLPEGRRNEVLATIEAGLEDFSISRPIDRTRGWGIAVPGDPTQTIYVWWDALGNYITALGYGAGGDDYRSWWLESDRRIHLIGKGIVRFHAIYWPAMLLSSRQPLPTEILIHDYLTVEGQKISKSLGNVIDPADLVAEFGPDAVRWWLLRAVPRLGDSDFRRASLIDLANRGLADGIGNLVTRTVSMVRRYRNGNIPPGDRDSLVPNLGKTVDEYVERFDLRTAAAAIDQAIGACNRMIADQRPWEIAAREASDPDAGLKLDGVLGSLIRAERDIVQELSAFLPKLSQEAAAQLGATGAVVGETEGPLFPRIQGLGSGPTL